MTPPGFMTWRNASKVGQLVPGTSIRIVDPETSRNVLEGSIGEVSVTIVSQWREVKKVLIGIKDMGKGPSGDCGLLKPTSRNFSFV